MYFIVGLGLRMVENNVLAVIAGTELARQHR